MLDKGPSALAGYFQVVCVHAADLLGLYSLAPVPVGSEQHGNDRQAFGGI